MTRHFAITLFPARRNAPKTPCASLDPYPRPDSSCGTSVWSRTTRPSSTLYQATASALSPRGISNRLTAGLSRLPSLGHGSGLAQRGQDLRRLLPYREVGLDERAA